MVQFLKKFERSRLLKSILHLEKQFHSFIKSTYQLGIDRPVLLLQKINLSLALGNSLL